MYNGSIMEGMYNGSIMEGEHTTGGLWMVIHTTGTFLLTEYCVLEYPY